jgi:hypothetical protein
MKRIGLVVLALVLVGTSVQIASGHATRRFRACTRSRGTCVQFGAEIAWGNTVVLKGKVRPRHSGTLADVLRRKPHGHVWREVAEVSVSDAGRMRYRWLTIHDDARADPYVFKFRIRGHGRSDATEASVYDHPTPSPPPTVT